MKNISQYTYGSIFFLPIITIVSLGLSVFLDLVYSEFSFLCSTTADNLSSYLCRKPLCGDTTECQNRSRPFRKLNMKHRISSPPKGPKNLTASRPSYTTSRICNTMCSRFLERSLCFLFVWRYEGRCAYFICTTDRGSSFFAPRKLLHLTGFVFPKW